MQTNKSNTAYPCGILLLLPVIFLLLQCTPVVHPHEAGDISIVDNKVAGVIYGPDGTPAPEASVVMRPCDYLPAVEPLAKRIATDTTSICSTTTGSDGKFHFHLSEEFPADVYCIEAVSGNGKHSLFIDSIVLDSQLLNNDKYLLVDTPYYATTLQPSAVITGTIISADSNVSKGVVRIYGLDRYASVDNNGSFVIDNIPEGEFRLSITFPETVDDTATIVNVETTAGDSTTVDTLYLLTYLILDENPIPVTRQLYRIGDDVVVPEKTDDLEKEGYTFTGWAFSDDDSAELYVPGDTLTITVTGQTLIPQWELLRYPLTLTTIGKGTAFAPDSVSHGITATIAATADAGEEFVTWRVTEGTATITDASSDSTEIILEKGAAAVQAVFSGITFHKTYFDDISLYPAPGVSRSAVPTTDGGYILGGCGRSKDNSTDINLYLLKTNQYGDTLWQKAYSDGSPWGFHSVMQTDDGGYLIHGYSVGPTVHTLLKTSLSGTFQWSKDISDSKSSQLHGEDGTVLQADDGGFVFAGTGENVHYDSLPNVRRTGLLQKLTSGGDVQWTKYFSNVSRVMSAERSSDGGYIIVGIDAADVNDCKLLIKTDSDGNTLWVKSLNEIRLDLCSFIHRTSDGGYFFAGWTITSGEPYRALNGHFCYGKLTASGDTVWMRRNPEEEPVYSSYSFQYGLDGQQTSDGGFVLAGAERDGQFSLTKITPEGLALWTNELTFNNNFRFSIQQTGDSGYIFSIENNIGGVTLVKTDKNGYVDPEEIPE